MKQEIWREYKRTQNRRWGTVVWEVSNYGNVKRNGEVYECRLNNWGYKRFANSCLHIVVAKLFIANPDNKPHVDHIDTNKLNNHADNLRWCTQEENNNNPTTKQHHSDNHADFTGENNPSAKKCIFRDKVFGCIKDARTYAKSIGISRNKFRKELIIL